MVDLSVVVPVYNGKKHLPLLLKELVPILEAQEFAWEVFFVDDHSPDGSFEIVRQANRQDGRIRGCRLGENRGQQNALFCGLKFCQGERILTMDDDGQHPVFRIPDLIRILDEGHDAVYMVNRDPGRKTLLRLGTGMTDLFFCFFCGKPVGVEIGSFRILRRSLAERLIGRSGRFVYISALIFRSRPRPDVISLRYDPNESRTGGHELPGGSRFSFFRRLILFLKLFLYYGPFGFFLPNRGDAFKVEELL